MVVIDTRPFLNYRSSRIQGAVNLYIPPLLFRRLRKSGCSNIERMTNCQDIKMKLSQRHEVPVVVYSDRTSMRSSPHNLHVIVESLIGDCSKLYILEDPYEEFSTYYPLYIEGNEGEEVTRKALKSPGSRLRSPRSGSRSGSYYLGATKPAEIVPLLYLGNERDSSDLTLLQRLGVSKVLNVSRDCENHFPDMFEYLNLPVEDRVYADISQHFSKALQFIEQSRGQGCSVLVHCRAGISRSATVIMAYLIQYYNKSLEEAFDFIKVKHPYISPNFNFMGQLVQFQKSHRSHTTVSLDEEEEEPIEKEGDDWTTNHRAAFRSCDRTQEEDWIEGEDLTLTLQPVPLMKKTFPGL